MAALYSLFSFRFLLEEMKATGCEREKLEKSIRSKTVMSTVFPSIYSDCLEQCFLRSGGKNGGKIEAFYLMLSMEKVLQSFKCR